MTVESNQSDQPTQSRRTFLRRGVSSCLFAGASALGYAYGIEPHWVDIERRRMPIAHLPDDLIGRRIVQISDLHVGEMVDDRYMIDTLKSLAALKPDMIAITGDMMTSVLDEQVGHTLDVLQHLPRTELGNYAVLGNHDYGSQWASVRTSLELINGLSEFDVRVLRNEIVDVAGLQVAGLEELLAQRCQVRLTVNQLDAARPMLSLCHNPDAADLDGWDQFQGWILCGHTHGGQCKLPGFAPPITPVWNKRYTSGEFQLSGNRRMYINRGIGYLRRVRFNCRPEVTVFTLERAESVATA